VPKPRRYIRDVHISVDDAQYKFVSEEHTGSMAQIIRNLIDAYRGHYNGELTDLEKEFPELEARYISVKKRIEELKGEQKQREDNTKVIEDRIKETHEKLLMVLKRAYWDPAGIQKATYKVYSEFSGLSVPELMEWVQEQAKKRDELES